MIRPVSRYGRIAAGLMLVLACAGAVADAPPTRVDLAFEVLRKGKPMGTHTIALSRAGDDIVAEIAIDLKLTFAFVTLFEYRHRNREVWRDGRLVSIETTTDNNGDDFRISGRATPDGFVVTDGNGAQRVFDPAILPTSYWHPRTTGATRLLNTQTGELASVSITPAPLVAVSDNGTQYVVGGDLDLNLWYDADGCLRKLNFRAPRDDSLIDYRPVHDPASRTSGACPARLLEAPLIARADGGAGS